MFSLPYNLYELKDYNNWVVYRLFENSSNMNKLSKLPFNPITHIPSKTNDKSTWSSYDNCIKALEEHSYDGIGFVFDKNLDYIGIDIDEGVNSLLSNELVPLFNSYTEYSPSHNGLHIICKYDKDILIGRKNNELKLEIYNYNRFFTITGDIYLDKKIEYRDSEIDMIVDKYFNNVKSILNEYLEKK